MSILARVRKLERRRPEVIPFPAPARTMTTAEAEEVRAVLIDAGLDLDDPEVMASLLSEANHKQGGLYYG